jgi:hypothetical protein
MTSDRREEITLGTRDSAGRDFGRSPVDFTLGCAGTHAYLLLANADGRPIALEQMSWDGVAWRLTLGLRPGSYRYRYYISDGQTTAYYAPADAAPVGRAPRTDGLDGVFDVAPPLDGLPRVGPRVGRRPHLAGLHSLAPAHDGRFV